MQYIFTTLIFVSFLSSIALLCIHYTLNRNPQLVNKKHGYFLICLILISIRLLLPFDLPFVNVIKITTIMPEIFLFLNKPFYTFYDIPINLFKVFSCVWAIGTLMNLIRLLFSYYHIRKKIHALKPYENDKIQQIMLRIIHSYKKPVFFKLVYSDSVTTPIVFGIRTPYIVIPQLELTDNEWYYVLVHEITHYYQGDIYLKLLLEVFHAIYWWNPLFCIIKKYVSMLLEINIDIKLSKQFDEIDLLTYLQCLLKVAKIREKNETSKFAVAFNGSNSSLISKRIYVVMNEPLFTKSKVHNYINYFITFAITICVLFLPNFYTIAPYNIPSQIQEDTFSININDAFLIQLDDNTYDLYLDGKFSSNIRNPEYISKNIKIYSNIEEAPLND